MSDWQGLVSAFAPAARLRRAWPLAGGVAAQVTALALVFPDGREQIVVDRRHGARDRAANPQVAALEFRLLRLLAATPVPAPAPIYLDAAAAFGAGPGLVIEYVDGETVLTPADPAGYARTLAAYLARIHAVTAARYDLSFLDHDRRGFVDPYQPLDPTIDEERRRAHLKRLAPRPARNRPVLLHGDFWPGNILWRDGRLVGIVDWEDARQGDPLLDLSRSRLELLWLFGFDAMNAFTDHYRSITDLDWRDLPYWDLCAAIRPAGQISAWAGAADRAAQMRDRLRRFAARAEAQLAEENHDL